MRITLDIPDGIICGFLNCVEHTNDGQWDTGPDDKHDWWKWREFLKIARIMNAEIKCKVRMEG